MFILLISILLLENFDCARTHGTFILISLLPASCSPSPNNKCRCRFAVMIFMNQQWFLFGSFILNTRLCVFGCFVCVFGCFVCVFGCFVCIWMFCVCIWMFCVCIWMFCVCIWMFCVCIWMFCVCIWKFCAD